MKIKNSLEKSSTYEFNFNLRDVNYFLIYSFVIFYHHRENKNFLYYIRNDFYFYEILDELV